jgi:hypothetical protein
LITTPSSSRFASPYVPVLLALVFLALHLPYLPVSLEDVDSINFALGIRRFDVAQHQPHPPGYPVFIAAAKAANALAGSEARALGALSVASGALGVLALAWLFRQLAGGDRHAAWPIAATLTAISSPLYWVTSARPLSDAMGLAAAAAVQALTLAVSSDRGLAAAAFCAGAAAGIRSQVVWLTAPLVVYRCFVRDPLRHEPRACDPIAIGAHVAKRGALAAAGFGAGVLFWLVPLVALTGGPLAYARVLLDQGVEDLSGVRMLWTTPTPRALVDDLYYGFVAPWAVWPVAAAVLAFATIGLAVLMRRRPRSLTIAAVAFVPYIAFDLIFQEFVTVRYALPIVLPIAWLATAGIGALPAPAAILVTGAIVMFDAHVGGRSIAALSRQPAPAFRALDDMRRAAEASPHAAVLAPDRRQSLDLRRPLRWLGGDAPRLERQLAAPPQHEWLEAVRYWDGGGRAPVWFVLDPRRAAIDLVQHGDPVAYRWPLPYPVLSSGTRPADLDWYTVDRPEWYVAEGWSLTPESAGVAEADRRGLSVGPIEGRIRRDVAGGVILLGGRNFDPAVQTRLTARVGGRTVAELVAAPGAFLALHPLPADLDAGASDYLPLVVSADPPARVGLEQFDASAARGLVGFGPGWHERELNPVTGRQWRWLSDRAELQYVLPASAGGILRIEGESPRKYYARDSRLTVRLGEAVLRDVTVSTDFTIDVKVPPAARPSTLVIETDQIHVPAERGWRPSPDRRRLGLRIFTCELRPAS